MEQIFPDNWLYIHFGLIMSLAVAQILGVYMLGESTHPPAGLEMYTVYFVAAFLGWIAFALQQAFGTTMTVDVAAIATIITSFVLFLAAGQRAGDSRGKYLLGLVCLGASISGFFLQQDRMFIVQSAAIALFYLAIGLHCARRASRERNAGDAIISFAAALMFTGIAVANYSYATDQDITQAQFIVYGVQSSTYALVAIGFLASVLIEYQRHLIQLATEDPLTRLFNRRGLAEALNVSLAAASRWSLPTSAILVDIDHFTKVNESFGQGAGDQVLQQLAGILNRMARASDVIARIGGEEFLLVLPDTTLESGRTLAERIRVAVGEHPLLIEQQRIHITVSLGVACMEGVINVDELSQAAGRAMYLAKRGGRNRVASVEHKPVHMTANSLTS